MRTWWSIWLGESDSRGIKRAKIDVLNVDPNVGNGAALAKKIARLERDEERIIEAREIAAEAAL